MPNRERCAANDSRLAAERGRAAASLSHREGGRGIEGEGGGPMAAASLSPREGGRGIEGEGGGPV